MAEHKFLDDEVTRIIVTKYSCPSCQHKLCNLCAYMRECHSCHGALTAGNLSAVSSWLEANRVREAKALGINPNMLG